jgi:ABC-type multidrug transport system ATPase subunit
VCRPSGRLESQDGMAAIITTQDLTKRYGRSRGIQDVTLAVEEGEIFGFLGPNGAGKTTTIRLLMGLLRPSSGSASIGGHDVWNDSVAVKRLVGYLPSDPQLDPDLTGGQLIDYFGHLRGGVDQAYVKQLVDRFELDTRKHFRDYSRGNKQKVGIVQAFMHKPKLLVLDEATSGLDPLNQQEFNKLLFERRNAGGTVFLSSHILPEVEEVCSRVGIIRDGELIRVDTVASLRDLRQHEVTMTFPQPVSADVFASLAGVHSATADGNTVKVIVSGDLGPIVKAAADHNATNLTTHEPSLEDVFLRYYNGAHTTPEAAHA